MVGVTSEDKLLRSGENTITFEGVSFDGITQGDYIIKCFAWNSVGSIIPLSPSSQKSVTIAAE